MTAIQQRFVNAREVEGPLDIVPVAGRIGAEIRGVQLSGDLANFTLAAIRAALVRHKVIFFRDQGFDDAGQEAFAARFGTPVAHPTVPVAEGSSYLLELNSSDGYAASSWHTDVTFVPAYPEASILRAIDIPEAGGDTLWANMYLAYESLSPPLKELVSNLLAVHSFAKNFTPERFKALGMEDRRDEIYAAHPPVTHPVARTNPATGRKALFVNQDFTSHIEGVTPRESEALLRLLFEHMAQPEFQVRWRWSAGTVAFWDNRWTQHCALADYFPAHRRMRRATVLGERPV